MDVDNANTHLRIKAPEVPALEVVPAPKITNEYECETCGKVCKGRGPFSMHTKNCQSTYVRTDFAANAQSSPAPKSIPNSPVSTAVKTKKNSTQAVAVVTERKERSASLALDVPNKSSGRGGGGGEVTIRVDQVEMNELRRIVQGQTIIIDELKQTIKRQDGRIQRQDAIVDTQNDRIARQEDAIKQLADQCMKMSDAQKLGWLPPFDPTSENEMIKVTGVNPYDPPVDSEIIRVKAPGANPGYNPIIKFGRLLWLTGIVSRSLENDAGAQTLSALQNMQFMLTQAGTDLKHLLRVTLHVSDIRSMEKTAAAWKEFFIKRNGLKEEDLPVRLTTQAVLKDPKFLVEVHAEAVLPSRKLDMQGAVNKAMQLQ